MSVIGWEVTSALCLVLVAVYLIPKYLKLGISTIPDFLEERFDPGVRKFSAYLFLIGFIVNSLPPTLYAGSLVMSQLFDIPEIFNISHSTAIWITVWAIGIIGSIYAIFGGLKAVVISDALNGIGLIVGGLIVPYLGFKLVGNGEFFKGIDLVVSAHPEKFNSLGSSTDPVPLSTIFTGMILVNMYYWGTNQGIIQRVLGAKNLKEGQKGLMFAGILKVLTPLIVVIPGIIAFHLYGDTIPKPDLAYSFLVKKIMPKYLVGFFAAVMFGAILSTFNSILNSAATLFCLNIYKPTFGKGKSEEEIVKKGRYFSIVIAIISMIIAPMIMNAPQGLFQYLQIVAGFFNVPIFTIIFVGYMTKRVPAIAAKVSLVVFVSFYAILQLIIKPDIHFLHQLAMLFILCVSIMLIIGKIKPMEKPYVLKDRKIVDTTEWEYRDEASLVVLGTMFTAYIVFSKFGLAGNSYSAMFKYLGILWFFVVMGIITVNLRNKKIKNQRLQTEEEENMVEA